MSNSAKSLRDDLTRQVKDLARRAGVSRPRSPREHLAAGRMRLERTMLARRSPPSTQRNRILAYHAVGTPRWGVNDVTPQQFRRQLQLALDLGYQFVPASSLAQPATSSASGDGLQPLRKTETPSLAVTFDDGLRSVATHAAPILAELQIPWTMFVVSEWADGKTSMRPSPFLNWDEIGELAAAGVTIGSHSCTHPDFSGLDAERTTEELSASRDVLSSRLGSTVTEFAIPFGLSTNWNAQAQRLAEQSGYELIYAQSEDRRPAGTIPRTFISKYDNDQIFAASLAGVFDDWEEWT